VLVGGGLLALLIYATRPEAPRRERSRPPVEVEVKALQPTTHQVVLESQGVVTAGMRSELRAQVEGAVSLDPACESGALVEAGALLAEVDPAAYRLAVEQLRSERAASKAALSEGQVQVANARARLALADERLALSQRQLARTQRLHGEGIASEDDLFTARDQELQVRLDREARAHTLAERVARKATLEEDVGVVSQRLARAELDLARTQVSAPYRARVVSRHVGAGQVVSRGEPLVTLYAVDRLEVSLPLTREQLGFLDLPRAGAPGSAVTLSVRVGAAEQRWEARVVRAEGVVEEGSRQLGIVARVTLADGEAEVPSLRPGDYVTARIAGRTLEKVFELPREVALGGDAVLVVDAETGMLSRRPIRVVWRTKTLLVADQGLAAGDLLCLTPLTFGGGELKVTVRTPGDRAAK
jgi:multidrug resistance efflux pump